MATEKTLEIQKKKATLSIFWVRLMTEGLFKSVQQVHGRTVGYVVEHKKGHALERFNEKERKYFPTTNHGKKSSKSRRLMAKASRKINRGK